MKKLRQCSDCNGNLSLLAEYCPHCGAPTVNHLITKLKRYWLIAFIVAVAALIANIILLDEAFKICLNQTYKEMLLEESVLIKIIYSLVLVIVIIPLIGLQSYEAASRTTTDLITPCFIKSVKTGFMPEISLLIILMVVFMILNRLVIHYERRKSN